MALALGARRLDEISMNLHRWTLRLNPIILSRKSGEAEGAGPVFD